MLLRDNIYGEIRRAILSCELEPGQELREQILAERFRVSRSPVRDALLRLELEGLVTVLPRQGYLVKAISIPDVEALLDLRLVVEPACAARAAQADDGAVRTLERFRTGPMPEGDHDAFLEYSRAFHFGVADICGNARLAAVGNDIVEQLHRLMRVSLPNLPDSAWSVAVSEHNAIIDAIQAHSAETASTLAHQHAQRGCERVIAALAKGRRDGGPMTAPPAHDTGDQSREP